MYHTTRQRDNPTVFPAATFFSQLGVINSIFTPPPPPCVSTLAGKNDNKLIPSHVVFILCFVRWTSLTTIPAILAAVSADHVSSCPLMRINGYLRQWPGWLRQYDTSDHSRVPRQRCKICLKMSIDQGGCLLLAEKIYQCPVLCVKKILKM